MPKKGYKQTEEHKNSIGKNFEKHKLDCQCACCKAKRGECKGKNHPQAVKKIPFVCQCCGKVKYVYPSYVKRAKYCSAFCAHIGKPSSVLGKHWKVKDTSKYKGSKKGRHFKMKDTSNMKGGQNTLGKHWKVKDTSRYTGNVEWLIAHPNRKFSGTKIELKIRDELEKRGFKKNIDYYCNVGLCNIANVDIYLPTYKLVIECDGCYYHACHQCGFIKYHQDKRANDIHKTRLLQQKGFAVYRFWEHEINESSEKCINKVQELCQ